jgi:hypothetical protein
MNENNYFPKLFKQFISKIYLSNYNLFYNLFKEYNPPQSFEVIIALLELCQLISLPLSSEVKV